MEEGRGRRLRRRLKALLLLAVLAAAALVYLNYPPNLLTGLLSDRGRKPGFYTVLLTGTMDGYNTDTIMMAALDTRAEQVRIVSIPRDTMIESDARNRKINACYGRGGVEELLRCVRQVTGIEPDFQVMVDVEGFMDLVDLVGGVDFYVPYDMYHLDAEERFTIDLEEGFAHLDGNHALQLVRYRGTSRSDLGRMDVQKEFLQAFVRTFRDHFRLTDLPDIARVVGENLQIDLSLREIQWFYRRVSACMEQAGSITVATLPVGQTGYYNSQSYVFLDPEGTVDMLNDMVNPYTEDLTVEDVTICSMPE